MSLNETQIVQIRAQSKADAAWLEMEKYLEPITIMAHEGRVFENNDAENFLVRKVFSLVAGEILLRQSLREDI